jgi:hypothetical protein
MQLDRMPLADIGNCVQLAKAVYRQLGECTPPIPIEEIAMAVGIAEITDLTTAGFEGALIANDLKTSGVILVKKGSLHERRRFTIGHELGHFLNYWHEPPQGGFYCSSKDMLTNDNGSNDKQQMECEANEFAAEMLMPEPLFRRDLRKAPSPGLEHVIRWATAYETSKLATTRRLVDLGDSPAALVQSKDGIVGYVHRRKDSFPFVEISRDMPVPRKSLTACYSGCEGDCSNTDETEPSFWISRELPRGANMLEQVLVQADGYRITLLTIDETKSEDEDDTYDRERSEWNPTFR